MTRQCIENAREGVLACKEDGGLFNTSLLSYPEGSSCAIQGPVPGTAFMPGTGEGRIVSLLVVMDRGGVRSPSSFLMT